MKTLLRNAAAATVLAGAFVGSAQALVACSNSDVTYGATYPDAGYTTSAATDCAISGTNNDSLSQVQALATTEGWGSNYALLDKSDDGANPAQFGITWTVTAPAQSTSGNWLVTGVAAPGVIPLYMDFIAVIKGGAEQWNSYFFDNVLFDGMGGGTFTISFLNTGGQTPGLSHLSLYGDPGGSVPEPGSLALLSLGLIGLYRMRRKSVN